MKFRSIVSVTALLLVAASPSFAQPAPAAPGPAPAAPVAPPPPAAPAPAAAAADAPAAAASGFALREAPGTRLRGVSDALAPTPGGLTADRVASRTREVSPEAEAKDAAIRAAAARVDRTVVMFLPRVKVAATYRRVSPSEASFGDGGFMVFSTTPGPVTQLDDGTGQGLVAVPLSFPSYQNQYLLTASLGVPLSDYVLRLSSALDATKIYKKSTEIQKQAALLNAAAAGRKAYYDWLRAVAAQAVFDSSVVRLKAQLVDTQAAFTLGAATKADVLRVEALVAGAEQMVLETATMRELAGEQLAVLMDEPSQPYTVGEDVLAPPAPPPDEKVVDLVAEAQSKRLELRALQAALDAQDRGVRAARIGQYPRLDAFADLTYARPNPTVFPQTDEWKENWALGLSLSYTLNDPLDSRATIKDIEATRAEVEANRKLLVRGIRLQVTAAHAAAKKSRAAVEAAARGAEAAAEGYRVARELYRAGRATTTDLISAEDELVKASLREVNALIDVKVADAELEHAVGRDVAGR